MLHVCHWGGGSYITALTLLRCLPEDVILTFVHGPPVFLLAKALKVVPQFMYAGHGAMVPVLFLRDAAESVWHGGMPTVAERGV